MTEQPEILTQGQWMRRFNALLVPYTVDAAMTPGTPRDTERFAHLRMPDRFPTPEQIAYARSIPERGRVDYDPYRINENLDRFEAGQNQRY